jgi:Zn-dependent protease with chaperone function
MQTAPSAPLQARWFDGRSSHAQPVRITLEPGSAGPSLLLHPQAAGATARRFTHAQVGWPEAWSAQRVQRTVLIDLGDAGSLEIDAVAQWNAMRAAAGFRAPLAERMQTRWRVLLAVLVLAAVGVWAFYRWGTPWAATQLTRQVPLSWETSLSARALQQLDGAYLKPSQLPAERQAQLRQRFAALAGQITPGMRRYPTYAPPLTLDFRAGMGANAFALPGGSVVMTDGLVQAAARRGLNDDALLGVLAHELGHVMHRHTTRMVVEQGVLNVGLGLALGDVSTVVAMGGSLLTALAYRRSHETEADCFAAALMRNAQLPTLPMSELLLHLDDERGAQAGAAQQPAGQTPTEAQAGWAQLLSSHPDTRGRAERLKRGQIEGC